MIRIPYGISNFKLLVSEGYIYIDRTPYIEQIESMDERYLFFVRPRRFGKSLFVSLFEYYYDIRYKEEFEALFSQFYIGTNPTKNANAYLVLKFDFSAIDTSSFEGTFQSFLFTVKIGVKNFVANYAHLFNPIDSTEIDNCVIPAQVINWLLGIMNQNKIKQKIYLLIDEYDHFANEILSFRFNDFSKMVSQNGFVRKFYEAIKVGTQSGIIDRLFVTGISPLTLDSLTSGFNIATNITLEENLNAMMGFTEVEVSGILKGIGVKENELDKVIQEIRQWYNGYLFSENGQERVYNSDMVLYFAKEYAKRKEYPKILLDPNIASDYTKIRRIFKIKGKEKEHLTYLNELLKTGFLRSELVRQYELERRFNKHDFISLLFYTGIITIVSSELFYTKFKMPNYVIKELYYQYFHKIVIEATELTGNQVDIFQKIRPLAVSNDIQPLINYTEAILTELAVRDKMHFDEKHVKVIFTSAFYTAGVYTIHNEFEVKKSAIDKGFVDILLVKRPPLEPNYQFVIEFKYLKKSEANRRQTVREAAVLQLKAYLQHDPYLQKLKDLKAYVVLFVGNKGEYVELVDW